MLLTLTLTCTNRSMNRGRPSQAACPRHLCTHHARPPSGGCQSATEYGPPRVPESALAHPANEGRVAHKEEPALATASGGHLGLRQQWGLGPRPALQCKPMHCLTHRRCFLGYYNSTSRCRHVSPCWA